MNAPAAWQQAARHLALDEAAVLTLAFLRAAGVDALLIKGPVTATRLYADEPHRRLYCDVDLLVAPLDFDRAQRALAEQGYRPTDAGLRSAERLWRETTWLRPGTSRLPIDLHRSLAGVGDPAGLWARLWRERTSLIVHGTSVPVPNTAATALIVALHAARPGGSEQPYRDLVRAMQVIEDGDWRAAIELARPVGALATMAAGFDAVPAARVLLERFAISIRAPISTRLRAPGISPAGAALGRLLLAGNRRAQLRSVVGRVFPSRAYMRRAWPAARTGRWGLVHAHGQRWRRFVRTMPQGVAELRRAWHVGCPAPHEWGTAALVSVRYQLAHGGLDQIELPPPDSMATARALDEVLTRHEASCLERSLVRQRFHAARGRAQELVIAVSAPGEDFHAHAWLVGDHQGDDGLHEILRRPVPDRWVDHS